jgi:hypothetical protein
MQTREAIAPSAQKAQCGGHIAFVHLPNIA